MRSGHEKDRRWEERRASHSSADSAFRVHLSCDIVGLNIVFVVINSFYLFHISGFQVTKIYLEERRMWVLICHPFPPRLSLKHILLGNVIL